MSMVDMLWQKSLLTIFQALLCKSPMLVFLEDAETERTQSRFLLNNFTSDGENYIIRALMANRTLYICDNKYKEPSSSSLVRYFRISKPQGILGFMKASTAASPPLLKGNVSLWRNNIAWSSGAIIVVAVTDLVATTPDALARDVMAAMWQQSKVAKVLIAIHNGRDVKVYKNEIYTQTCGTNVSRIIDLDKPIDFGSRFKWNLHGCRLLAASTELAPYVFTTNPAKPLSEGLEVIIFKMLGAMMNFTYKFVFSPEGEYAWSTVINGTPAGLIGRLHRHEADILFHGVRLTWDRFRLAEALDSYHGGSYVWAAPLPGKLETWKFVFIVFDPLMWFLTLLSFVVSAVFILLLKKSNANDVFLAVWGMTLNAPVNFVLNSQYLRFISAVYLLYIVNISAAYQSGLFKLNSKGAPLPSFESATDAIRHNFEVTMFPTMIPEMKENSPEFYDYITSRGLVTWTSDALGSLRRIAKQKRELRLTIDLLVTYENNLRFTSRSGQQFVTILKERFSPYEAVFYMPKDHPLLPTVKIALRRLVETGWVIRSIENLLERARDKRSRFSEVDEIIFDEMPSLSLSETLGTFFILIFMLIVSSLLFLIELCVGGPAIKLLLRACKRRKRGSIKLIVNREKIVGIKNLPWRE